MKALVFLMFILVMVGCTGPDKAMDLPLRAPTGTPPAAAAAVDAGNSLFGAGQWEQAKTQYETALKGHPTLAEAHYDLALVLDRLGSKAEAMTHYKEAANLAPGNRVIWNAPPFRKFEAEVGKASGQAIATPGSTTSLLTLVFRLRLFTSWI